VAIPGYFLPEVELDVGKFFRVSSSLNSIPPGFDDALGVTRVEAM
jgi:hypothetical protein